MLLVADSGSTKADWILVDDNRKEISRFSTMGFNPFFHDSQIVEGALSDNDEARKIADVPERVYFYGAGCSSPVRAQKIAEGLEAFFSNSEVLVNHDLVAAAYATSGGEECIPCILGTGSNSCYFDGEFVIDDIPALGYILGDEGSGSYYGKKLLTSFLYKRLPKRIESELRERYKLTKESIFENIYMKPNANVYLASFAKFLSDNRDDLYVEELIGEGMLEFLAIHVCRFENYRQVPVHFVGSIAFFFEDILRSVAKRRFIEVGSILKQPVYNLVDYHLKQLNI